MQPVRGEPALVKLEPRNAVSTNAAMTSRMTANFHHTATLLTQANQRTPKQLMTTQAAIATAATS